MPCAASPPSTFCQEKVTTSSLAQSRAWAKQALVASQMASPARSAAMKSAFGTRTPEVVPFQVNTRSASGRTLVEVRQRAVGRVSTSASSFSCLTTSVTQSLPKLSKASTCTGQRAQHRPQGHLDGAGVGGRARCRSGSRPAPPARRGSGRWRPSGAPCRAWSGASGRAARIAGFQGTIRGAWRRGRMKIQARAGRMAGLARVFMRCLPSLQMGSAPLGGRGPPRKSAGSGRVKRKRENLNTRAGDLPLGDWRAGLSLGELSAAYEWLPRWRGPAIMASTMPMTMQILMPTVVEIVDPGEQIVRRAP